MALAFHGYSGITPLLRGLCALLLVACAPAPAPQVGKSLTQGSAADPVLTPATLFPAPGGTRGQVASGDLAQDFLDLSFGLESGRALVVFSRFEAPLTLALTGEVPPTALPDLAHLLARLRAEAGLDLGPPAPGTAAAITVAFHPRARLQRLAPDAACFVVPNLSTLEDYGRLRGSPAVDWTAVQTRTRATIFIPSDSSPQEVRDCLHEELAQALGPLNDLYRLSDSVFNDDNFHSTLTAFDMRILAMTYAPELRSGMSRDAVAAVLPQVTARLTGTRAAAGTPSPTPRGWTLAIETALAGKGPRAERLAAAERATAIARARGWADARTAFGLFATGRLLLASDPQRAVAVLDEARAIYARLPGGQIQAAHVDMQLAAAALAAGRPAAAASLVDRALPQTEAAGNAALLATLLLIKAEALDQAGLTLEARALRLDSLAAARYGFGSDAITEARRRDIAVLAARGRKG